MDSWVWYVPSGRSVSECAWMNPPAASGALPSGFSCASCVSECCPSYWSCADVTFATVGFAPSVLAARSYVQSSFFEICNVTVVPAGAFSGSGTSMGAPVLSVKPCGGSPYRFFHVSRYTVAVRLSATSVLSMWDVMATRFTRTYESVPSSERDSARIAHETPCSGAGRSSMSSSSQCHSLWTSSVQEFADAYGSVSRSVSSTRSWWSVNVPSETGPLGFCAPPASYTHSVFVGRYLPWSSSPRKTMPEYGAREMR